MTIPSIKGTAFALAADDLQRLVAEGRISQEQLEARLEGKDLAFLEEKVFPGLWYPIDTYGRALEILLQEEASGRTAYLVERGAKAAERFFGSGIYRQLELAEQRNQSLAESPRRSESLGNLMLTVAGTVYNFMSWTYQVGDGKPELFVIEISEASSLPDPARYTIQGFIEYATNRLRDESVRVESSRPEPDRIRFRAIPA